MIYVIKHLKWKHKNNYLQNITRNEFQICLWKKHTFQFPAYFELVEIFNDYNSNHRKSSTHISLNMILKQFLLENFILTLNLNYEMTNQNFI